MVDKKETKTPAAKSRRTTKAKEELEAYVRPILSATRVAEPLLTCTSDSAEGSSTALAARTPKNAAQAKLLFPANVPLPASPRDVADSIDRQTRRVKSRLSKVYKTSGVAEYTDDIRDRVSSSATIETFALIVELLGLRSEILPMRFLTTLPASKALGTGEIPIKMIDVFALLTATFWSTFILWFVTSVALPLTAAYFFNPTLKARHGHLRNAKHVQSAGQYDPLTFNIMKALTVFLVYGKDVSLLGWPGEEAKARIQGSVPGGYQGVLIASGIGALTSLYEAVLKK